MKTMKKKFIWLIALIPLLLIGGILLFLFGRPPQSPPLPPLQSGTLHVNGVSVSTENVMIRPHYATLPLTEVLKGLGMDVDWLDNDTAEITYGDKTYILKPSKVSLIEVAGSENVLTLAPGSKNRFCQAVDRELIVDGDTVLNALFLMGVKVYIYINSDELIVSVVERT